MSYPVELDRMTFKPVQFAAEYMVQVCQYLDFKPKSIVEIGVFDGSSSRVLISHFPDAEIYLIDPWRAEGYVGTEGAGKKGRQLLSQELWDGYYETVSRDFEDYPNVRIIRTTSIEASNRLSDFDLIFLDADHSYKHVLNDIKAWLPKLNQNGLFICHDYGSSRFPGVKRAVDQLLGEVFITPHHFAIHRG